MGRTCCVPGCKSNYRSASEFTSTFKFPKDPVLKEKWLKCIRLEESLENDVVCINHFDSQFIIREDIFPVINDEPIRVLRKNPKLTSDAIPTIFPNQPSYHKIKIPEKRKDPSIRFKKLEERDTKEFIQSTEHDEISNFESFKSGLQNRDTSPFLMKDFNDFILFYKIEIDPTPSISSSFKVSSMLEVDFFFRDIPLLIENFKCMFHGENSKKCDKWSVFDNIISHFGSYTENKMDFSDRLTLLIKFLEETIHENFQDDKTKKIKFLLEQLQLTTKKKISYSADLLVWSATLSYSFPGAYNMLRQTHVMTLPHPVYLRRFLTKIGPNCPGVPTSQKQFLKEKCKYLKDHEKIVTISLDEIYISSKFTYQAGMIHGMAENTTEAATTMQVFMYNSLLSHTKDVIGLFPVKNMNAQTLLELTRNVINVMCESGFDIVSLISDNHSTNRKMFEMLCGGSLKPSIPHPCDETKCIFILFDNVHILKCLRNNWLNIKNQTLAIPDVDQIFKIIQRMNDVTEGTTVSHQYTSVDAKFCDLKNLFHAEKDLVLKLAPKLSRKALYPTSIERQNVSLAVNIFDSKNISALEILKNQGTDISQGTIQYLKLIGKWWNVCNVQHPMKGIHMKNNDAQPIKNSDDEKLKFLEDLKIFLDIWHTSHEIGKLTNETHLAFTHTLTAMVELCKYIFQKYKFSYILTSKLQTDCLEVRFGAYRRLSGCTYNVTVEQVLESERKLKVLGLLKLKSAEHGEFSLSDFSEKFKPVKEKNKPDAIEILESAIGEIHNVTITDETKSVFVCIASYTSLKVSEKLLKRRSKCSSCMNILKSAEDTNQENKENEDNISYFNNVNRGGLKNPSAFMIFLTSEMYKLFQVLISDAYEPDFLKLVSHQDALVALGMEHTISLQSFTRYMTILNVL